jgi:hypothetical protein
MDYCALMYHFQNLYPGSRADLRIEIFMLKLVHTEHFTVFGHSRGQLRYFENFVFPIHLT